MSRGWSRSLTLFTLSLVVVLAGCTRNPSTGRFQLTLFPADQIAAMGEEAKPQLIEEFGGEVGSAELRNYIVEVGTRLTDQVEPEYDDIAWEFITLNSDVINAFALPGGKVFITRGLLSRFDNEAQVAGVLGHEIGHVTARHIDERLSQSMIAQFGLKAIGGFSESALITEGAGLLVGGTMLKFGRDQESESDSQGLKYMIAAGYAPEGMIQVLEVLLQANAEGDRPPEILATHPYPETRLERVRATIDADYPGTRGNPAYKKRGGRFARSAKPHLH